MIKRIEAADQDREQLVNVSRVSGGAAARTAMKQVVAGTKPVPAVQHPRFGGRNTGYTYPSWRERRDPIVTFLKRQANDLRQGGVRMLARKAVLLVEAVLAVPAVLLARLIRPIVLIRFGSLPTGMSTDYMMEIYLCERDGGLHGRRTLDLFCSSPIVSNKQMKKMWERTVPVSHFARAAERVNRWLPGGERNKMPWMRIPMDLHSLIPRTTPHLSFTSEEERRGWVELRALGIADGVPFVCVNARDPSYKARVAPHEPKGVQEYRDTDITTYVPAAEAIVHRGYMAIRMGAIVQKPLRTGNPRIIDYATTARTEFLDVFLCAHCQFFLGDSAGLFVLPMIFRRPIVMVNYVPLQYITFSADPRGIFITKKFWLRDERRLMTFREILESGAGRFLDGARFARHGIELIDNTPEEIAAAALEMDDRLNGTWQTTEEDEDLQRRFQSLLAHSDHSVRAHLSDRWPQGLARPLGPICARMGTEFLRQHQALLEERTASGPVVASP